MYSDTHFHFKNLAELNGINFTSNLLCKMVNDNVFFGMDIGTQSSDLLCRMEYVKESLDLIADEKTRNAAKKLIYFTGGIWPEKEAIANRFFCVKELEEQIQIANKKTSLFSGKVVAVGECGLDHHWNPSGADARSKEDFTEDILKGEKELFAMQIELAKKLCLPVIVHSRDAFEDTLQVISDCNYDFGIIHCFSYDLASAKAFLDRGWYIAFGGAVTYAKKKNLEEIKTLLRYVPEDRFLLETDAPYLSPVPLRGTINSPANICHTYKFIAEARNCSVEDLCSTVDKNCKDLFLK